MRPRATWTHGSDPCPICREKDHENTKGGLMEDAEIDRYEAPALCFNCKFEGPVRPEVGKPIWTVLCPVCRAAHVSPTPITNMEER